MAVDWTSLGDRLATEIVGAVAGARSLEPGMRVSHVELADVHVRDMLVLWPTIEVHGTDPATPPVVVEGSREGDLRAAAVTALGGPGGTRWDAVFSRFHQMLAAAGDAASRAIGVPVTVRREVDAPPERVVDIDRYVAVDGPLDYGPLAEALSASPGLDASLVAGLSTDAVREVDSDDVATALVALDSPWESVRRHAAIVLLSVHL